MKLKMVKLAKDKIEEENISLEEKIKLLEEQNAELKKNKEDVAEIANEQYKEQTEGIIEENGQLDKAEDIQGIKGAGRGVGYLEPLMPANFMLLYGGKPGVIVSAETKFITDIMSNIERLYDKPTQTIDIPHIFDFLEGSDTNIEIVVSSMLQATKLGIRNFPAIKSKSFIFVQEKLVAKRSDYNEPLVYPKAKERANQMKEFFQKDMQFTSVEVCMNLTKDEIVDKI